MKEIMPYEVFHDFMKNPDDGDFLLHKTMKQKGRGTDDE